jgi:hypothetical protein
MNDIKVNGTIYFVVSIERSETEGIRLILNYITTFMSTDIVHGIG